MKNLRHGRFWDKGLVGLAAVGLAVGCAMLCIFPAPRFSAAENRNLTEWPLLTAAGLGDGSYTTALEAYATERFPARSLLRQTRSLFHLAQGTCEVGGVLLCRDGSLATRMTVKIVPSAGLITARYASAVPVSNALTHASAFASFSS